MKANYEKHQRDYTILATSLVMEEFFSDRFEKFFSCRTRPMYLLVRDGVLYHYLNIEEKKLRADSVIRKNSYLQLEKYIKGMKVHLRAYRRFLANRKNLPPLVALDKLHDFMALFTAIIVLVAETPLYKNLDKKTFSLFLKTRKDYDDVHRIGMDIQKEILRKIEKQNNLPSQSLKDLLINEFREYLKTGNLPQGLVRRSKFFFASYSRRGHKIYSAVFARQILKGLEPKAPPTTTSELSGQPAFKGKVSGRVRLIKLINEAKNLKKGEILVTAMTDPRYLPAMKKAAAIITDEGGITCHAAIVSRELKIPCVVGTKIATQVLRDGQRVSVDANQGLVKIIK